MPSIILSLGISNCETRVLNKFSAHRLKKFKSLVLLIVMIVAHI